MDRVPLKSIEKARTRAYVDLRLVHLVSGGIFLALAVSNSLILARR